MRASALQKSGAVILLLLLAATGLFAQTPPPTSATKDDWEEINFEFNSSILVDGFPSLLRVSELLQKNPTYRVRVEGHTDVIGNQQFNEKLGLARANSVREFLVKYGANTNQITVITRGKDAPKYPGQRATLSPTDEARWMNRRVTLVVLDGQGKTVGAGSPGDAIRAMEPPPAPPAPVIDCCADILRRLDKLDEIARALQSLAEQNGSLRKELADLKAAQDGIRQGQQNLDNRVGNLPKPPSASDVAAEVARNRDPRFQSIGANIGADSTGNVTVTGRGRFFAPFSSHFGFQAQGEYMYFKNQREGQFDVGLVDRIGRLQAGLFASFKHVSLDGNQSGGTLGQGALAVDYLFKSGRLGIFGTKGFMDNAVINRANAVSNSGAVLRNIILERYLGIVDQGGASGTVNLWRNNYLEGNVSYLHSRVYGARTGGTLRFVFPLNDKVAIAVEGGMNETLLARENTGRAVVGVLFGNALRPKDYLGVSHAIAMEVPRVRYEVLTRRIRLGNDPPVADAGPDQGNVPAGTVTLDGSNSYDPDGDPITFQWTQEGGPVAALSSSTAAKTTFAAALGQIYTFRLTVKDDQGAQSMARVRITTRTGDRVQVVSFLANPTQIERGASSTLSWRVLNADTVSISGIGTVPASGTAPVSPQQTTTYTLTARNGVNEESATAVVAVTVPANPTPRVLSCSASPTSVAAGQIVTLNYATTNADTVTIQPGVGNVAKSGSVNVTPQQTTTYTVTATSAQGSDTCGMTVTVGAKPPGNPPVILSFTGSTNTVNAGQPFTLSWNVRDADKINISVIGDVAASGSQSLTPANTTTYTITATNAFGSATAQFTITVNQASIPKVTTFVATPNPTSGPGAPSVLSCQATGATSITMAGILFLPGSATYTVRPDVDTTYTCIATGANGSTDTKTLLVRVTQPTPPIPPTTNPPTIVFSDGTMINTIYRFITLDASRSFSPVGATPLKFSWSVRNNQAAIIDPTSPTPNVQLGIIGGDYLFDLTVTDSRGVSSTSTLTVRFTNTKVQ